MIALKLTDMMQDYKYKKPIEFGQYKSKVKVKVIKKVQNLISSLNGTVLQRLLSNLQRRCKTISARSLLNLVNIGQWSRSRSLKKGQNLLSSLNGTVLQRLLSNLERGCKTTSARSLLNLVSIGQRSRSR